MSYKSGISKFLILATFMLSPVTSLANWTYESKTDKFTDEKSSGAFSKPNSYGVSREYYVGFACQGDRFSFQVQTGNYIEGKGELFALTYRVDEQQAQTIPMKVFKNSSMGGYNEELAIQIAKDTMGGGIMNVRAVDFRGDYHDSLFNLKNSDNTVKRVLADCDKLDR